MDLRSHLFKKVVLQGWRQFEEVEIELHYRLTIITGANGAGKSSILRIFSRHFGFDRPYLSTPVLVNGSFVYLTGIFRGVFRKLGSIFRKDDGDAAEVGELTYSDGHHCRLSIPKNAGAAVSLAVNNQQPVAGIHVDSHQAVSSYQPVGSIPSAMLTAQQFYDMYLSEISNRYNGGYTASSPIYRMKEALLAMITFGEGNSRSAGNPSLKSAFDGFIAALKKVLPPSLGFLDIVSRGPEIVVQTKSGEFLLDAASGGITTLFDITFRLHMFSIGRHEFVVTMDEPENHLHPSMQRSLMPRLIEAFPRAQFIIATHSPFIVSSVKDSAVYVLRYNHAEGRVAEGFSPETTSSRVISERLDTINRASTANEILREVLGVEATVPEWVAEDVRSLVRKYGSRTLNSEVLGELRGELTLLGYESQYPAAMADLVRLHDQAN